MVLGACCSPHGDGHLSLFRKLLQRDATPDKTWQVLGKGIEKLKNRNSKTPALTDAFIMARESYVENSCSCSVAGNTDPNSFHCHTSEQRMGRLGCRLSLEKQKEPPSIERFWGTFTGFRSHLRLWFLVTGLKPLEQMNIKTERHRGTRRNLCHRTLL